MSAQSELSDNLVMEETSSDRWAPYYGSRRSLRRYEKSSKVENCDISVNGESEDVKVGDSGDIEEQENQSWAPYYGARRSLRRYEKTNEEEERENKNVVNNVKGDENDFVDEDCSDIVDHGSNAFVRSFSKPSNPAMTSVPTVSAAQSSAAVKRFQRTNSLPPMKLKDRFNFRNSSKLGEGKGVMVFSTTSFAQHIDIMPNVKGTENTAFVPDDNKSNENLKTLILDHCDGNKLPKVRSDVPIVEVESSPPKDVPVKDNILKLSLKRAPVQIPGLKCGILEYPYAYVTHNIARKDSLKGLI